MALLQGEGEREREGISSHLAQKNKITLYVEMEGFRWIQVGYIPFLPNSPI